MGFTNQTLFRQDRHDCRHGGKDPRRGLPNFGGGQRVVSGGEATVFVGGMAEEEVESDVAGDRGG